MTTVHPPRQHNPVDAGPQSVDAAIDLLLALASSNSEPQSEVATGAIRSADLLRGSFQAMHTMQGELAGALIDSQDRILAMKALAQVNVQGLASDQTIGLLLDKAMVLTKSCLVVLLEGQTAVATVGMCAEADALTQVARESIVEMPHAMLRNVDADRAMICAVDPDGEIERHIAFFRGTAQPFSTVDIPLIEAIVSALGLMLAFNEVHQRELQQAAVEREHQLASALAQSAISTRPPVSERMDICSRTIPASITGGDFYVFGQTDTEIWFAVGDVAGKGLPAAMLMTRAVTACRVAFLAHRDASVVDVFARVEDELFDHLDDAGVFITLALGVVDEQTRTVSLANAGHSPVVHVHDSVAEFVPASVPPLGVIRGGVPTVLTFALGAGDSLVLGSDGLAEQPNAENELFGYDRFRELCATLGNLPSRAAGDAVFTAVNGFAAGVPAADDSTLVIFSTRSSAP